MYTIMLYVIITIFFLVVGPAIVLSFIGAALAVSLVVVCYTEFASRVHKTGTTYLYTYLTLGELPAFLIGWAILVCKYFNCIKFLCSTPFTLRSYFGLN